MAGKTAKTNPVGRPVEYQDKYCSLIRMYLRQGYSKSKFCSEVGISRDSFYRWQKEYPEFKEACTIALEDNLAYYEDQYLLAAEGKKEINIAALKEARAGQHGSVQSPETKGNQINIGNINILQQKSDEELLQALEINPVIKQLTHKIDTDESE